MNHPYRSLVSEYPRLAKLGQSLPLGGFEPLSMPALAPDAPAVLVFSPHPDDECIIGALALRLRRELRWNVTNVAVTQGSKKERQAGRWMELQAACQFLGFGLIPTIPNGLEKINPKTRQQQPDHWASAVEVISGILQEHRPRIIFMPHAEDWNSTHIGTHFLVSDALMRQPSSFECWVVETEFWGAMNSPNLMIESSVEDVADLIAGLSCHVEEVRRNPYHLTLPAWMQDNVRRGGELVGGQGGAAPNFCFATLYRLQRFGAGKYHRTYEGGKILSASDNLSSLFA